MTDSKHRKRIEFTMVLAGADLGFSRGCVGELIFKTISKFYRLFLGRAN